MALVRAALPYSLFLYCVAILTSMAGMEIFGWLTAVLSLILLVHRMRTGLFEPRGFRILPSDWALLAFFLVVVIGAVQSPSPTANFVKIVGSVRWIFLYFLVRLAVVEWEPEAFQKPLFVLSGIGAIIGGYAIIQHYTGIDLLRPTNRAVQLFGTSASGYPIYRSAGLFSSPMTYGNSVGLFLCFPLAIVLAQAAKSVAARASMTAAFLLMAGGLISTFTRGVWVGFVATLLLMAFFLGRKASALVLTGFGVVFSALMIFSVDARGRVLTIFDGNYTSNLERFQIWQMNLNMFKDHPFFGVGYGENETLIRDYYERAGISDGMVGHAHNTFVQILSGTGILGFSLFLFALGYFFVTALRLWRQTPKRDVWVRSLLLGAIGAQVFLAVAGLTECNFKDAEVNHQVMMIFALIGALRVRQQRQLVSAARMS